jgi:selenocysteine lyase/cysteine desulfurase
MNSLSVQTTTAIEFAAELFRQAKRAVVLTGADFHSFRYPRFSFRGERAVVAR